MVQYAPVALAEADPRASGRRRQGPLRDRRLRPGRAQDQVARAERHVRPGFVREMEMAMRVVRRHDLLDALPRPPLSVVQRAHLGVPQRHRPEPLRAPRTRRRVTIGWAGGVGHKASLARWEPAHPLVMRARPRRASCPSATRRPRRTSRSSAPSARSRTRAPSSRSTPRRWRCSTSPSPLRPRTTCSAARATCAGSRRARSGSRSSRTRTSIPDIEDGVTGVHAREPDEVEAALLRLIDNPEERERIGDKAHEYVPEHRRVEVAAERWPDVLREVVAARAPILKSLQVVSACRYPG